AYPGDITWGPPSLAASLLEAGLPELRRFTPLQAQFLGKLDRPDQAVRRSYSRTGDIERRAVIYRRPDDRQAERDIHASLEIEQLRRNMALIVIHADDRVELLPPHRQIKEGVRGKWPVHTISPALSPFDRRDDLPDLLVSKRSVFSSVRI